MTPKEFEETVVKVYLAYPREKRNKIRLSVFKEENDQKDLGFGDLNIPKRIVLNYCGFRSINNYSAEKIKKTIGNLLNYKEPTPKPQLHTGDTPFCSQCGHLTIRSGTCFKCLNCGNSEGCS